jgi:hypothetical protein
MGWWHVEDAAAIDFARANIDENKSGHGAHLRAMRARYPTDSAVTLHPLGGSATPLRPKLFDT